MFEKELVSILKLILLMYLLIHTIQTSRSEAPNYRAECVLEVQEYDSWEEAHVQSFCVWDL
jgi:hypothetical protein